MILTQNAEEIKCDFCDTPKLTYSDCSDRINVRKSRRAKVDPAVCQRPFSALFDLFAFMGAGNTDETKA